MAINQHTRLLLLATALLCTAGSLRAQQTTPEPAKDATASATEIVTEPLTPADMLPTAPRVDCQKDHLSIHADNSTLGSILNAVQSCLGVRVDIPAGGSAQRVFTDLGPGPVRQVLGSLLSSTDFDYAIGTADGDPEKIQNVVLMTRGKEPNAVLSAEDLADGKPMTAARRAYLQNRRAIEMARAAGEAATNQATEETAENDTAAQDAGSDNPPDAAPAAAAVNAAPASTDQPAVAAASTDPTPPVAPVRTDSAQTSASSSETTNRIANMQQMFEQRKQMVQSQRITGQPQ